jgi:hypothetical protein
VQDAADKANANRQSSYAVHGVGSNTKPRQLAGLLAFSG